MQKSKISLALHVVQEILSCLPPNYLWILPHSVKVMARSSHELRSHLISPSSAWQVRLAIPAASLPSRISHSPACLSEEHLNSLIYVPGIINSHLITTILWSTLLSSHLADAPAPEYSNQNSLRRACTLFSP